jgi:hypothetical protein
MRLIRVLLALSALVALSQAAFASDAQLTDKQFANRSADEIIGIISTVQISSSNQYGEQGTVQIEVEHVLTGTITVPTLSFQYAREFMPLSEPTTWDLIAPSGKSLRDAIGERVLLFLVDTNGSFSLYPASNSVQAISDGTLVGTLKIDKKNGKNGHADNWKMALTIDISETVYGWVKGGSITLPVDISRLSQSINDDWCDRNDGQLVLVDFSNWAIDSITIAGTTILDDLQKVDSE